MEPLLALIGVSCQDCLRPGTTETLERAPQRALISAVVENGAEEPCSLQCIGLSPHLYPGFPPQQDKLGRIPS